VITLTWRDVAPGEGGPPISTSLTLDETTKLRWLAAGADVLEIGSAYGYSAVAMALAGARVVAVDPHNWLPSLEVMQANLAAYEVEDQVDIRVARSNDEMPQLHSEGRLFDLVWIDGDHSAEAVTHDVTWALKLLHPGTGILACHDYDEATCPGVRQALDAWKVPEELVDTLAIYRGPA
jgi:predicted O-methyltransferase YrrM